MVRLARFAAAALALLAPGCITALPAPSIPAGHAFQDATTGVVLLRYEWVDGDGDPIKPIEPLRCTREGGETYELGPVAPGSPEYEVALPAGDYRIVATTGAGITERWYVLRFHVDAGAVQYVGLIRHHMAFLELRFRLHDDYDAAARSFRARHPGAQLEVKKALFEKYSCNRDCVPEEWGANGGP